MKVRNFLNPWKTVPPAKLLRRMLHGRVKKAYWKVLSSRKKSLIWRKKCLMKEHVFSKTVSHPVKGVLWNLKAWKATSCILHFSRLSNGSCFWCIFHSKIPFSAPVGESNLPSPSPTVSVNPLTRSPPETSSQMTPNPLYQSYHRANGRILNLLERTNLLLKVHLNIGHRSHGS